MNGLDLIVLLALVFAAWSGWRRRLVWVALSYAGLGLGVLAGSWLAPPLAHAIGGHARQAESMVATVVFLVCVAGLQSVGIYLGYRLRTARGAPERAWLRSGAGAAVGTAGAAAALWYAGLCFANLGQAPVLVAQIQGSGVLGAIDTAAPAPPAVLWRLEQTLGSSRFPNPFAGLATPNLPDQAPPELAALATSGVTGARGVIAQVRTGERCGFESGTAWPVGAGLWVTNAHVVSGSAQVLLVPPALRNGVVARVIRFDPSSDVAVLSATTPTIAPLRVADANPAVATQGAIIGYPNGGPQRTRPAAVKGEVRASGRDISGADSVTRTIEVLHGVIIPGNSGGPIVDLRGRVIGVIFATNLGRTAEGYALALSEIRADLAGLSVDAPTAATGGCVG